MYIRQISITGPSPKALDYPQGYACCHGCGGSTDSEAMRSKVGLVKASLC